MSIISRHLKINLPEKQSCFLWGPRKTGKSTLLKLHFAQSAYFDLLDTDLLYEYTKRPGLFGEHVAALSSVQRKLPILVDEIQKVPPLMDEIHRLIERERLHFVLCGSSARKLKRVGTNLLGGRAWRFALHPFTTAEIGSNWQILDLLNRGLIPTHLLQPGTRRSIKAYVQDYLKEEVFAEGLTRNIPAFSRFFEAMAFSHGELVNYSNIARECGVDSKTVKEYYQILVDTLLGRFVEPYRKQQNRQVITRAPKFYLFDVGVAGGITRRNIEEERGAQFGAALEHLILMELSAHANYTEIDYPIHFWRTKTGLEVDFILGRGEVAIEVKGSKKVGTSEMRPIKSFIDEHHPNKAIIVCNEKIPRKTGDILILPYRNFFEKLWAGDIIR